MKARPIGVIDSGLGGLSILNTLTPILKNEKFIYLADHQYCPYGDRTSKQINQRLVAITNFLLEKNCKLVVVACNTITTTSINFLRSIYPAIFFVGTVPAIKPAIEKNLKENIIVLATQKTVSSEYFQEMIFNLDKKGKVHGIASPGLVESIESGNLKIIKQQINKIIKNIKANYSAIVLGCTHYILVKDIIKKLPPFNVVILEPSQAIAKQTCKVLKDNNLLSNPTLKKPTTFYLTTGNPQKATQTAKKLLNDSIIFDKCSI